MRIIKSSGIAGIAGLLVGVIGILAIAGVFFYLDDSSTEAINAETKLEREFRSIKPLPNTNPFDYLSTHKMHHALVTEKYITNTSFNDISSHYQNELVNHGWKFVKEEPVYDWNRDFGGKILYFRKDDFTAALQFEGDKSDFGYTYAFSVSWGLHNF